jgi:hypothetical protein
MAVVPFDQTLAAFAVQAAILAGAGVAAQVWRRRLTGVGSTATEAVLLGAAAPALLGYTAFWLYFLHPLAGRTFSWLASIGVLTTLLHAFRPWGPARDRPAVHGKLIALTACAGVFYLAVLLAFPLHKLTDTAAQRFHPGMPGDGEIPRIFAERLYIGVSPKAIGGDWLSSDRPPLQAGVALVVMPLLRAANVDFDVACATAGVWFQLLWIPAVWLFLRWLGLVEREAYAATGALVFTGFLLFNSVFVWPKLAGGALVLLAFLALVNADAGLTPRARAVWGGLLAALATLAHGGVMFSLVALVPGVFWRGRKWRKLVPALLVFGAVAVPWLAYQRCYEPPGNRLVKWHVAGAIAPDSRGVLEAMAENYAQLGLKAALATRQENAAIIGGLGWSRLLDFKDPGFGARSRFEEITYLFRTLALWVLALVALPWLIWRAWRRQTPVLVSAREQARPIAWLVLTLLGWWMLMFFPKGTIAHQGSYAVVLLLLGLLAAWAMAASRWFFLSLSVLQLVSFVLVWLPGSTAVPVDASPMAGLVAGASALLLLVFWLSHLFAWSPRRAGSGWMRPVLAWCNGPRAAWLGLIALAMFLRKPHALTVPQLYAEDGSIFLAFNDLSGVHAFIEPYMGYLHTLPRLVAWAVSRLFDPAWWPAFYNGAAFAGWLFVVGRIFSPRLDWPAKPWLALALVMWPQTGEVLSNLTNLQWCTALLLVQQAVIARPVTWSERVGDAVMVLLVGLTGPFVVALVPLLVWRWWRDRRGDNAALVILAGCCAAVQAWFVWRTGPKFAFPPFDLGGFLVIVGQHLLGWSALGDAWARSWPRWVLGAFGLVPTVVLLVAAFRPSPLRRFRVPVALACLLMLAAVVYRSRPDTWNFDNLWFGDRYFYLPRVLLFWLLVWEFHAGLSALAWLARGLYAACVVVHLPGYILPAPPNYHWSAQVEPIRRGVPANLPTLPEGWTLEYRGRPGGK